MLDKLKQRLVDCSDLESVLACALSGGLELSGASRGNIQLMDWNTGYLTIMAQCGFDDDFLRFFHRVSARDGSACGRAIRERRPIVVDDVLEDPEFAPFRAIALKAGFRAVQSTPLISSSGAFLGVLSTHFAEARRCNGDDLQILRGAAGLAANAIIHQRARQRDIHHYHWNEAETVAGSIRKTHMTVLSSYARLRRARRKLEF